MRYILSKTKAHRYVDDPDAVVYAGWGMLFYYTINGEAGRERSVVLKNGKKVTFTLPNMGSGVLLDAKTGELLLEAK